MERKDVERWLENHPETIHTDPDPLLDRCEAEVRRHTRHDAWAHARAVMEERLACFEHAFGLPASDAFVAREVCHEVARALRRREPEVEEGSELAHVSESLLRFLDPPAREELSRWLLDLARAEEHVAWLQVVHFTDRFARDLIREGTLTNELRWDFDHSYTRNAARVARILIREVDTRLREEPAQPH